MNIKDIVTESQQACPHCGGPVFEYSELGEGKKDACYYKVKASAKVWPSAYASGRLVQCRKKGAANYGNKSEGVAEGRKKKKSSRSTGGYFFPGYGYYGSDSGEGGGDGGGESVDRDMAEGLDTETNYDGNLLVSLIQNYTPQSYAGDQIKQDFNDPASLPFHLDDVVGLIDEIFYESLENGSQGIVLPDEKQDLRFFYQAAKKSQKQGMAENFADGRNPQDKGDAKRHGINTKASVSSLRKTAKSGGRKGQLAHWLANMKSGRAKNEGVTENTEPEMLFYAKLPEGTKVYARVKDEQQLADLQQQYRGAEIKTFDFQRPDVQKWLEARRINLRKFTPGMVQTMYDVMEAAHTTNFNDDDWYEINPDTKSIVSQRGPQAYQVPFGQRQITLPNGNIVVRGMRAKGMGLDTGLGKPQQKEDGTWGAL